MRRWLAFLIVLILCAACAGSSPLPGPTPPSPSPSPSPTATPEPKRLTVCLSDEPDSLYIYGTDSPAAHHVWHALYDGPIDSRDYGQQPIILTSRPALGESAVVKTSTVQSGDRVLAASGSVMNLAPGVIVRDAEGRRTTFRGEPIVMEHMVVTFTLRSDIRWSDGEWLTAEDSVYSFELAASSATATDRHVVERTADYRAVGDYQIVWQGVPGFFDRAYFMNVWHPLPRHAWEGLSAAELLSAEVSTRKPLGWGPFILTEWSSGNAVTLERNPLYFRGSEGLPRLDEVTFRFIADKEKLAELLLAGTCDVVTHEASEALDLDELDASPAVETFTTHDSSWELLAFGISPAADYNRPDFFEDVRVRQAIAQCIDRQAVADEALGPGGRVLNSYLVPEHPAYAGEELTLWPFDPERGKLLLAQAGWYDEDNDGIREAHGIPAIPEGTPFQVTYSTTDDTHRLRTATQLQFQLRACGIDVTLRMQAAEVLFAPGPEGELFGRRYDLAQFSWQTAADPLCDTFLSSQIPGDGEWSKPNVAGFIDSTYDAACQRALETLPGGADYLVTHAAPQHIFSQRVPVLPLFQHQKTTLARASVVGLSPNISQPSELWNLEQLDIQP